tara:strand:+ start:2552 stop:2794 length:243 start_codon:yes stop_codon:yes gene_type:complete
MEEFITDITKIFMIKNCCYHNNEKKNNIIIKTNDNDNKWKNYRGINGIHSNEMNKIYKDLEYNMEFKKDNNPKTPRRVPV